MFLWIEIEVVEGGLREAVELIIIQVTTIEVDFLENSREVFLMCMVVYFLASLSASLVILNLKVLQIVQAGINDAHIIVVLNTPK